MSRPVKVKIEVKRKYAYLSVIDYGYQYYDDDVDSCNDAFIRLGWDCDYYVTVHRIIKEALPIVEAALKAAVEKSTSMEWSDFETAFSEYLTDTWSPLNSAAEVFRRAGVEFKITSSYGENLKT